ncbi:MAG: hypothetical protein GXP42_05850 [Chloroflexi bacterium]|nr:hypothetical protein [Chloroflexota bacterium]
MHLFDNATLAETAAWHWFLYESGLKLARAKRIILERFTEQSLHEILYGSPLTWDESLGLSHEEVLQLEARSETLEGTEVRLQRWQAQGVALLRLNQPGYPATLTEHLNAVERPLLLAYRGDLSLLELPMVLALAGAAPDEEAAAWATETLAELMEDGALPLVMARPGLDATLARAFLDSQAPFALIVPRGLATYDPPPALRAAVESARVLLLSPFRADWSPPSSGPNPLLPHAAFFAQALAHALLIVEPPHPEKLLPQQPCFLRPGIPKTVGCQTYYSDSESFFMRLIEAPLEAAPYLAESAPSYASAPTAASSIPSSPTDAPSAPEPTIDPDALVELLSQTGAVPEVMRERLQGRRDNQ